MPCPEVRHLVTCLQLSLFLTGTSLTRADDDAHDLIRLPFNNDGLIVDLGVGLWAWPLPMDYDEDGDPDLVVVCPDTPYNGTYFFENPGTAENGQLPIFKPSVRISKGIRNAQVSYPDGRPVVLSPDHSYPDFRSNGTENAESLGVGNVHTTKGKIRANQWRFVDYNGDGRQDLAVRPVILEVLMYRHPIG